MIDKELQSMLLLRIGAPWQIDWISPYTPGQILLAGPVAETTLLPLARFGSNSCPATDGLNALQEKGLTKQCQ